MLNALPEKLHKLQYDTIIIGSGVGGLSSAICLARKGEKVLVLEQHDVPGGWCHSFYLNGHRFTPGVHYVGLMGKGEPNNDLMKGLGIANDISFFRMNSNGFEHCWIGDDRFDYPADFEALKSSLSEKFPKERKAIHKYLNLIHKIGKQLELIPNVRGFWQKLTIPFRTKHMGKYAPFTLKRVLGWRLKNPLLKAILSIQYGDHGLAPYRANFVLHSAVMAHYFKGGYYPLGGGGALVKAMTNKIKKHEGEIKTSTTVKRILIEEHPKRHKAIGVELENGDHIFAKKVISNADPGITFNTLIDQNYLSNKLKKRLTKTKYSCTSLMLFLIVDIDVTQFGIDSGNIWIAPHEDLDALNKEMEKEDITTSDEFPGLFISCTTLKDPSSFDGKHHTMEIITYINRSSFDQFSEEDEERSPEYLKFKERLTEKFLNSLERVIPNIKNHIVHKDLGTPLTNEYYINSSKGSVYGTEKSLGQIGPFSYKPKTEIENLYLCGASIAAHGVAGASYSGVQTAAEILGCIQADLLEPEAGQEDLEIYDAEDSTYYPESLKKKIKLRQKKASV